MAEKYSLWSPYNYCANNPINLVDFDGMDWYKSQGKAGHQAVAWREGNAKEVDINGQTYSRIGTTYTQNIGRGVSVTYTQNEATSITFSTNTPWVSQFSKSNWGGTPASKACAKASDEMLGGGKDSESITITLNNGNGTAGGANINANKGIQTMENTIESGKGVKFGVDYKPGSSSSDGMADHFVVGDQYTQELNSGKVVSTKVHFLDPGTSHPEKGTSESNVFKLINNRLEGKHINIKNTKIVVTNIRIKK